MFCTIRCLPGVWGGGTGIRLGRCFCFAEVSAEHQHSRQREALVCAEAVILYVRHPPYLMPAEQFKSTLTQHVGVNF